MQLFQQMRAATLVPNSVICRELVHCLCMNLHLDEAINILEEMIEIRISLLEKMSERGIADCDCWNILLNWICENASIKKAYELLGRMIVRSVVPDCGTYAALVVGNCNLNNYEDALELFHYIRSKFWVLDSKCYSRLVEGLCRLNRIEEAVVVYYYMSKSQCPLEVSTFNLMIEATCDARKVDEAVKLRSLAYYSGCRSEARNLLDVMLERGFVPDATTHSLFVGSDVEGVTSRGRPTYENPMDEDNVSNILAEALGK